ncbi:MAG: hypothetical protein AAFX03_13695 [Pseudomonadota bacterium]
MQDFLGWAALLLVIAVVGWVLYAVFPVWVLILAGVLAGGYFLVGSDIDR